MTVDKFSFKFVSLKDIVGKKLSNSSITCWRFCGDIYLSFGISNQL